MLVYHRADNVHPESSKLERLKPSFYSNLAQLVAWVVRLISTVQSSARLMFRTKFTIDLVQWIDLFRYGLLMICMTFTVLLPRCYHRLPTQMTVSRVMNKLGR
ncbi:hypothetical protein BDR07DRAFT_1428511 [Suillus spraguei]|nr:hypothetical protein BDR07DRAFT_1428511 [Suillus spraguei]